MILMLMNKHKVKIVSLYFEFGKSTIVITLGFNFMYNSVQLQRTRGYLIVKADPLLCITGQKHIVDNCFKT